MPPPDYLEPSFGARFLARIVDGLVLLVPVIVLSLAFEGLARVVVIAAVGGLYEVLLVARDGQTIGKRTFGLRVIDFTTGAVPTSDQALRRWFVISALGTLVSVLTVNLLGLLVDLAVVLPVLQPPLHRGLHDRAATTIVTRLH